jgi:hypothetical protein
MTTVDPQTEVVPPLAGTQVGGQLAWSQDDPEPMQPRPAPKVVASRPPDVTPLWDRTGPQTWGETIGHAVVIVLCCVAVACVMGLSIWMWATGPRQ